MSESERLAALLARAADVTFVLDVTTGAAMDRFHDAEHSLLPVVPLAHEERLVSWIHPDDLPAVLDTFAKVMHDGGSRPAVARLHPDHDDGRDAFLGLRITDIRDVVPDALLVQTWVTDANWVRRTKFDPTASLSSLAGVAPVGLQVRNAMGDVSFENDRFRSLVGDAAAGVEEVVAAAVADRAEVVRDVHSRESVLRVRVAPRLDDRGRLVLAVVSVEDITQLHRAETERAVAEELFRAVFHGSPFASALLDVDGCFLQVNESFTVITGYPADELLGRRFQEITHPDDVAVDAELKDEVLAGVRPSYQLEKRYRHRAGHDIWVELTVGPVPGPDGTIGHLVAHVADISARRAVLDAAGASDDLAYWAMHDHLTGLPNRRHFESFLSVNLERSAQRGGPPVVLFLDLDDFKPVNDQHGHGIGDEVLRTIARRLRNSCRGEALVARYGGDEFVIGSRQLRTSLDVSILVDRIHSAVSTPIHRLLPEPISVGVSIGIAIATEADTAATLVERADRAAMRAKAAGKNRVRYDDEDADADRPCPS